jgi:hypothetical protein
MVAASDCSVKASLLVLNTSLKERLKSGGGSNISARRLQATMVPFSSKATSPDH